METDSDWVPWRVLVWILEPGSGVAFHSVYSLNKKAVVRFLFELASFCLTPEVCHWIQGSLGQVYLGNASDDYMRLYVSTEPGSLWWFWCGSEGSKGLLILITKTPEQTNPLKPKLDNPNKTPLLIQEVLGCQECVISSRVPILWKKKVM